MNPLRSNVPRSHSGTRTGEAALTNGNDLIRFPLLRRGLHCNADGPATRRRRARDGDIAADTHENACIELVGNTGGRPIGHECLGRRSEVEASSPRNPNRPSPRVKVDMSVPDDWAEDVRGKPGLIPDLVEIAVVAEGRHGIAYSWVNGPMGPISDGDGYFESLEEQRRHADGCARTRMKVFKFGVWAKATARQVDGLNLVAQKRFRRSYTVGCPHNDGGRRPDGSKGPLSQRSCP